MEADGIDPEFPDVGALHLVSYLFEIGPTMPGGMGDAPLTHGEIRAWQDNTGIDLHAWEARYLRRLSIDYMVQSQKSVKADCPSPYQPDIMTEENRSAVAKQVTNAMRAYQMAKPNSRK